MLRICREWREKRTQRWKTRKTEATTMKGLFATMELQFRFCFTSLHKTKKICYLIRHTKHVNKYTSCLCEMNVIQPNSDHQSLIPHCTLLVSTVPITYKLPTTPQHIWQALSSCCLKEQVKAGTLEATSALPIKQCHHAAQQHRPQEPTHTSCVLSSRDCFGMKH